nr:DUF4351 domain-containing protein [Candidatus Magnetobacterium casensis]
MLSIFAREEQEKGRQEGRQEGVATMLLRMLRARFAAVPPGIETMVMTADTSRLEHWGDRIFSAQSLQDVFGEEVCRQH